MRDLMGPCRNPPTTKSRASTKPSGQSFQRPETVHAAHIVKHVDETHPEAEARAGIEAALAALESGEPFAAVADRIRIAKATAAILGAFARGVMVEEFDNVVFAMKPGQRSPIFRTPFGFHIAEVHFPGRRPASQALREAKDTIRHFLVAARERDAARRVTEQLRAQRPASAAVRRASRRPRPPNGRLMSLPPPPCCVPARARLLQLNESRRSSAERRRATAGSTADMVRSMAAGFSWAASRRRLSQSMEKVRCARCSSILSISRNFR
jgi:hypothetical protein